MEKRTQQLIIRWSLVTGGLIALFWTIWYLIAGEVPVITGIKMTEDWIYILPFGISRWWDVLIGPIWSIIIIFLLTQERSEENEITTDLLTVSSVAALGFSLIVALGFGLLHGLFFGLLAGLAVGLGILLAPSASAID